MKEYIVNNADKIGWALGVILLLTIVYTFKTWSDTKYEVIFVWMLVITGIVGAGYIGDEIAKWIVK